MRRLNKFQNFRNELMKKKSTSKRIKSACQYSIINLIVQLDK